MGSLDDALFLTKWRLVLRYDDKSVILSWHRSRFLGSQASYFFSLLSLRRHGARQASQPTGGRRDLTHDLRITGTTVAIQQAKNPGSGSFSSLLPQALNGSPARAAETSIVIPSSAATALNLSTHATDDTLWRASAIIKVEPRPADDPLAFKGSLQDALFLAKWRFVLEYLGQSVVLSWHCGQFPSAMASAFPCPCSGVSVKAKITHEMRGEGAMLAFTSKSGYPTHALVSHTTSRKDDNDNGETFSVRIPILHIGTDRLDVLVVNITATAAATLGLDKLPVPSSHVVMIRLAPRTANGPLLFQGPLEDALLLNKNKVVVMRDGKSVELCSQDQPLWPNCDKLSTAHLVCPASPMACFGASTLALAMSWRTAPGENRGDDYRTTALRTAEFSVQS